MTICECNNQLSGVPCTAMVGYCRVNVVGCLMRSSSGRCMGVSDEDFLACSMELFKSVDIGLRDDEHTW